jgi:hypothetical protein
MKNDKSKLKMGEKDFVFSIVILHFAF